MAPKTRKRPPRNSYIEEPDSPKNKFDKIFKVDKSNQLNDEQDEDSDYVTGRGVKRARKHKHRSCSHHKPYSCDRLVPEISDLEDDIEEEIQFSFNDGNKRGKQALLTPMSINLQLPVHLTDTNISINLNDILHSNLGGSSNFRISTDGSISPVADGLVRRCLIDIIPTEIRTRILRYLFVTKEPIYFTQRHDFKRSAQALRTSRVIHEEGTRVLYGENCFHFERALAVRGKYWESQWKEIGFKDIHRFLDAIGENKKKLKYVSFKCLDAVPVDTPYLLPVERRFVNDVVLRQCFQMIADNTILERFAIGAHGRAIVTENDYDFLRALTEIRCYELTFTKWFDSCKLSDDLMDKIRKLMEIEEKDVKPRKMVQVKMPFEHAGRSHITTAW